jgi:membrane protease YdiL (CAAX protease family)
VLALIAVVGLMLRAEGPMHWLAPRGGLPGLATGLAAGLAVGLAASLGLWLVRNAPSVARLERWLVHALRDWAPADCLAVALLSGLAEEALFRALVQPLVGLLPAAILFAALHAYPDRRLWFWPMMALAIGCIFGSLYQHLGYPAAAAAHAVLNAVSMVRLGRRAAVVAGDENRSP